MSEMILVVESRTGFLTPRDTYRGIFDTEKLAIAYIKKRNDRIMFLSKLQSEFREKINISVFEDDDDNKPSLLLQELAKKHKTELTDEETRMILHSRFYPSEFWHVKYKLPVNPSVRD